MGFSKDLPVAEPSSRCDEEPASDVAVPAIVVAEAEQKSAPKKGKRRRRSSAGPAKKKQKLDDDKWEPLVYNFDKSGAELPEFRTTDPVAEYIESREEKMWSPVEPEVEKWMPLYSYLGRSALTTAQKNRGIGIEEAMENASAGNAEQYINDVLHQCEYAPIVALNVIELKEPPNVITARWTSADAQLFSQGIARHGKNFNKICRDLLPTKTAKDMVYFYYHWKWTEEGIRSRRRRSGTKKACKKACQSSRSSYSATSKTSPSAPEKIVTRSQTRDTSVPVKRSGLSENIFARPKPQLKSRSRGRRNSTATSAAISTASSQVNSAVNSADKSTTN